ncbi:MAG: TonB-dependent receptor [Polyangiales bacterium]
MALAVVWCSALQAQDYRAAARATRSDFDSARSETRVTRAVAERAVVENVGGMLSEAQGLVVSRTASISAVPIIRGLTGSSVLLMQDELRLNDSLTRAGGNALLNLLDLESIQDLEVVRGPASVLYGSDALGGVVRVNTRALATDPTAGSSVGASIFGRGSLADEAGRLGGSVQAVHGSVGLRLSGALGRAGLTTRGGGLGEQAFTGHHDGTFASRLQLTPSRHHELSLSHQSGHQWDVPRSDVSKPDDQQRTVHLDRDAMLLRYGGNFAEQGLRVQAFAGMALRRELRERLRDERIQQEHDRVLSYQLGASVTLLPAVGTSIDIGADGVLDRIGSGSTELAADGVIERGRGRYLDGSRYDMGALYALWSQTLTPAWKLLVGGRATLVHAEAPLDPLFDAAVQERLDRTLLGAAGSVGVRFDISSEVSWVLSGLTGFRAPNLEDFQAFGGGARGFTVPSPRLHAEQSWTAETGVKWSRSTLQASAYLFGTMLTGLIVRVPSTWDGAPELDDEPVLRRENASRAFLLGGEAQLSARWPHDFYTSVAASAVWGETRRTGEEGGRVIEPATKIPGPVAGLRVGWDRRSGPLFVELAGMFQLAQTRLSESDRLDVRLCENGPDDCERVAGFVNVAVRAGVRLDDLIAVTLIADNLFDAAYKTYASGAYATGRNVILGLRGAL